MWYAAPFFGEQWAKTIGFVVQTVARKGFPPVQRCTFRHQPTARIMRSYLNRCPWVHGFQWTVLDPKVTRMLEIDMGR